MTQRLIRQSTGGISNWSDLQGKPSIFPSNWGSVADKPVSFASTWELVIGKPLTFDSAWETLANKPSAFASTWDLIAGKPASFASTWELVTGKPLTFASTWESVANKPANFASTWDLITGKPTVFPTDWSLVENKPLINDASQVSGVWTPSLAGSVVRGNQAYASTDRFGWYVMVGKWITVFFGLSVTAMDTAINGNIFIDGLPFKITNTISSVGSITFSHHAWLLFPSGYTELTGAGTRNTNQMLLRFCGHNVDAITCTHAHLREKVILRGTMIYVTD